MGRETMKVAGVAAVCALCCAAMWEAEGAPINEAAMLKDLPERLDSVIMKHVRTDLNQLESTERKGEGKAFKLDHRQTPKMIASMSQFKKNEMAKTEASQLEDEK